MRFLLMIYSNEADGNNMTEADINTEMQEYYAFSNEVRQRNAYVAAEALKPIATATTVRVRDDKTLTTDGPFAETHEQLGGFYLVDVKDLDEAIELAAKIPSSRRGSVEVRPVVVFE